MPEENGHERDLQTFREAVENAGHSIYWTDTDGTIQYVNPAFEKITGYDAEEAIGQNPNILKSGEMPEEYYEDLWETISSGETWEREITNERKNGDRYVIAQTVAPVENDSGGIDRYVSVGHDVTDRRERERQLQRFRQAVESAGHIVFITDTQGVIEYVNPAFEEVTGYDAEEAIGQTPNILKSGEMSEEYYVDLWTTILSGEVWSESVINRRKSDELYHAEQTIAPIVDDGDVTAFVAIQTDVTERKERQRELERYETILNNTNDVFFELDENLDIAFITDRIEAFLNVDREALLGQSGTELAARMADETVEAAFVERASAVLSGDRDEAEIEFPVETDPLGEAVLTMRLDALEYESGDTGLIGVAHDITRQKERERELKRQNERLAAIFENTKAATVEYVYADGEPIIEAVNDAFEEVFGYDADAVIGHALDEFIVPPADSEQAQTLNERVGQGEYVSVEVERETADGVRSFLLRNAPIKTDDEIRGYALYLDVTERKEYERQLEEQMEQLEMLNRMLRHDINNDMNVVLGMSESVKAGLDDPESERRLRKVMNASENVVELTRTARDLMETMLNDQRERKPVRLVEVLEEEIGDLRMAYDHAIVQFDAPPSDYRVLADDLLGSVFRNLLKNSIYHNEGDVPEISVGVEEGDGTVRVTVADDGPGVPDDQKDAIFGKGQKGLDSEGTGIGLYLVQTLVDSYGGSVWVEDREGHSPSGNRAKPGDREAHHASGSRTQSDERGGAVFVVELETAA